MDTSAGRLTALARPIDLDVASNRFAVFAALGVLAIGTVASLATGHAVLPAAGRGLAYGTGAFLAWAVAREIAPDRPLAAKLTVAAFLPAMWLGLPALAALFTLLIALRIVVRSTGSAPTQVDLILLVVLAAVASMSSPGFIAALALAYAVHADRKLPEPADDRSHEITAVVIVAVALATTVVSGAFLTEWQGIGIGGALAVALVAAAATRFKAREVQAVDDTGEGLWLERLIHARRLLLVTLAVALVWAGGEAIAGFAPAGAAVIGTAIAAAGVTLPARLRPGATATSEAA